MGCHCLLQCMKLKSESEVTQSCPTLSDPINCSPPGFSVHGIFQARVLEWGVMLSRLIITFLPRSKRLLISWLQLPSEVILEPKQILLPLFFHFNVTIHEETWALRRWLNLISCWLSSFYHLYPVLSPIGLSPMDLLMLFPSSLAFTGSDK